ncbi:hypothetical protein OK074_7791 [Actinobacteria bacterium OK074]|nr:hypothetical protein OK074_7791 [Actinobacteria bacterium OK074]
MTPHMPNSPEINGNLDPHADPHAGPCTDPYDDPYADPDGAGRGLRLAFEAVLDDAAEPPLGGVVDAAVTGGRRIRRRRVALSVTGGLMAAAVAVTVAVGLGTGTGGRAEPQQPLAPAHTPTAPATTPATPQQPSPSPSLGNTVSPKGGSATPPAPPTAVPTKTPTKDPSRAATP